MTWPVDQHPQNMVVGAMPEKEKNRHRLTHENRTRLRRKLFKLSKSKDGRANKARPRTHPA